MSTLQKTITYIFLGSMAVLVVMNAGGFATAFGSVSSGVATETGLLSGSGYVRAK